MFVSDVNVVIRVMVRTICDSKSLATIAGSRSPLLGPAGKSTDELGLNRLCEWKSSIFFAVFTLRQVVSTSSRSISTGFIMNTAWRDGYQALPMVAGNKKQTREL